MNKVIVKYKNGETKEVKTKLLERDKIVSFLKVIGEWNSEIIGFDIEKDIVSGVCNYQNIDGDI